MFVLLSWDKCSVVVPFHSPSPLDDSLFCSIYSRITIHDPSMLTTMNTPNANAGASALQKEKQLARDQRPDVTRTASCNGDSTTKARHFRGDLSAMSRQSDQTTSRLADWSKASEGVPSIFVNGNGDGTVNEEPLPPPEITSTSVMATIRLEGSLSDLKEAIKMYEEFDKICRGGPI